MILEIDHINIDCGGRGIDCGGGKIRYVGSRQAGYTFCMEVFVEFLR